jgi:hypothetical protein
MNDLPQGVRSPLRWDGETTYSDRVARSPYEAKCLSAGHIQTIQGKSEVWLTSVELRSLRPLPRCEICGGNVGLEPTDVGAIASPFAARPRLSKAAPADWGTP